MLLIYDNILITAYSPVTAIFINYLTLDVTQFYLETFAFFTLFMSIINFCLLSNFTYLLFKIIFNINYFYRRNNYEI